MTRRWLLALLSVGFLAILLARRTELLDLHRTLASGRWAWVAVAAALQAASTVAHAQLYRSAFAALGVASRLADTLPVLMGSLVVNFVVPSGGVAGAALFVDDAARRGQSAARAAAGVVLVVAADLAALAILLLGSLALLAGRRDLGPGAILGTAVLLALVGGLFALLALGTGRPRRLRRLLDSIQAGVAGLAERWRRPAPLAPDWAERTTRDLAGVSRVLRDEPGRVVGPLAVALAMHGLAAACLGALFLAFRQGGEPDVLIAGYAFGILAWIVSPVPQGVGVVEAVMALAYASLGVPAEAATAIALAFRGLAFWLPMGVGFFLLRRLKSFRPGPASG